ncbi:MAG: acyl carrier protein [Clostridia bacterium]|nr:acyl carrier protein [Clostridia bacterium]
MEQLLEILNRLHPDVDFAEVEDLYEEGVLDSLDMVRLVTEIANEFDVQIPAEELLPENFQNVNTIYALIRRLDEE